MKSTPDSSRSPTGLRGRAEKALAKPGRRIELMHEPDVQGLAHDLQVHEIELEMQNEELRRTQEAFEAARDRFADLYDFAPLPLLTLGEGGEVLEANLAAASLLALARKHLIHQKFSRFLTAEARDPFYSYCRQVLQSEIRLTGELTLRNAAGISLVARLEGIAAEDPGTHKRNCRLSLIDITERKEAERRRDLTSAVAALFAQKASISEYLHSVVQLVQQWSGSQALGIRLVNEHQELPYEAWVGFEPGFIELENRLSLQHDDCCCIRAIAQAAASSDTTLVMPHGSYRCEDASVVAAIRAASSDTTLVMPHGSYRCDNARVFAEQLPPPEMARCYAACVKFGFASVATVPIHCREGILGAIHLADRRTGQFPPGLVEFVETLTPLIGEAVRRFQAEDELAKHRDHLQELVAQRTRELEAANEQLRKEITHRKVAEETLLCTAEDLKRSNLDLEQFGYVASH